VVTITNEHTLIYAVQYIPSGICSFYLIAVQFGMQILNKLLSLSHLYYGIRY